jgi:Holliday junction resolvasome RuvABC endonuclease subunit
MNVNKIRTNKPQPKTVLGIDASTTALAFCLYRRKRTKWYPVQWGKMHIDGNDVYERCGDINRKLYGLLKHLEPDHVSFESVVFVNNRAVVIQLAKVVGAAIGVAQATGSECSEVPPITWMNYIGNPTRDSKEFKTKIRKRHPGKSASWYKSELRRLRKQRTRDWVKSTYKIDIDDDDVTDAFGVGYYATQELV